MVLSGVGSSAVYFVTSVVQIERLSQAGLSELDVAFEQGEK